MYANGNINMNAIPTSTAQGGGGSFKHRKPIGEIGCCESRMAEKSTDGPKGGCTGVFLQDFLDFRS